MGEPGADTIEQLVRAVLAAVDARLEGVRHELAAFAADVERKHHQVLEAIATVERRAATRDALEQLESIQRANNSEARDRINRLQERLEELRRLGIASTGEVPMLPGTPPATTATPAPSATAGHPIVPDDLTEISRPLIRPGATTGAVPLVGDTGVNRITSLPVPPLRPPVIHDQPTEPAASAPAVDAPAPAADAPPAASTDTGEIDIEALTRMLDERLGHLTLPPQPE